MIAVNVVFYPNTNPKNGFGHISRCFALYNQLVANGIDAQYYAVGNQEQLIKKFDVQVIRSTINSDDLIPSETVVVVDNYDFTNEDIIALKSKGFQTICIDDFGSKIPSADLIINHGEIRNTLQEPPAQYLYGLSYSIIHPDFKPLARKKKDTKLNEIILSFGGSSPRKLLQDWLACLLKVFPLSKFKVLSPLSATELGFGTNKAVEFIWGYSSKQLNALYNSIDLAIVPSSNLSLEVAASNTNLAVGTFVDNQKKIHANLIRNEVAFDLGNLNQSKEEIEKRLNHLKHLSTPDYNNQLIKQKIINSKKSGSAIALHIRRIAKGLSYRNAAAKDCEFIFNLANDESVRNNSINSEPIIWSQHKSWFDKKIMSNDLFHIYEFNNTPIGYIRIENKNGENIISIAISNAMRGKKIAPIMIGCSSDFYLSILGNDAPILAYIWDKNPASAFAFQRAEYVLNNEKTLDGRKFSVLAYGN